MRHARVDAALMQLSLNSKRVAVTVCVFVCLFTFLRVFARIGRLVILGGDDAECPGILCRESVRFVCLFWRFLQFMSRKRALQVALLRKETLMAPFASSSPCSCQCQCLFLFCRISASCLCFRVCIYFRVCVCVFVCLRMQLSSHLCCRHDVCVC